MLKSETGIRKAHIRTMSRKEQKGLSLKSKKKKKLNQITKLN